MALEAFYDTCNADVGDKRIGKRLLYRQEEWVVTDTCDVPPTMYQARRIRRAMGYIQLFPHEVDLLAQAYENSYSLPD